ncbi:dienelactone hydrolase family protein [Undibacterium sp. TS12]|uniref:dienelactone hydrolase family protein n=1 Tax=Undibacterium sp. TS12 TaxID=2908202 RepID=UPI001F4C5533|nr:dienelactone hydrolase family protein [Undibacterium sp. TS12]MCH8618939.1 dienelactone hydrolase family protein [Undibacterium sp. TS12]
MRNLPALALLSLFFCTASLANEPAEKVQFTSLDMQNGAPIMLDALWLKAKNPARGSIIALHGCGGLYSTRKGHEQELNARHENMAQLLQDNGYNVLMPDSFRPRGVNSICTTNYKTRDITTDNRRLDVQAAIQWLIRQTGTQNIGLLGWSNGGSTTLSALNTAHTTTIPNAIYPRAAVVFYPGCQPSLRARPAYQLSTPLLILTGADDDWTPAQPCIDLEKKLEPGAMKLTVFANSYHDFDAPNLPVKKRLDVPNGVHPGSGVTTGSNPEAKEIAYREMLDFFAHHLGKQ